MASHTLGDFFSFFRVGDLYGPLGETDREPIPEARAVLPVDTARVLAGTVVRIWSYASALAGASGLGNPVEQLVVVAVPRPKGPAGAGTVGGSTARTQPGTENRTA
jgi:hypothetical protein